MNPVSPDIEELIVRPIIPDPEEIPEQLVVELLKKLRVQAKKGRMEIEAGNWARFDITDGEFSRIVPKGLEEAVFLSMLRTGDWYRGYNGFRLLDDLPKRS